jgi:hypothetical protein
VFGAHHGASLLVAWRNYAMLAAATASRDWHDDAIDTSLPTSVSRQYVGGKLFDWLLLLHCKSVSSAVRDAALFACERASDATHATLIASLRQLERTLGGDASADTGRVRTWSLRLRVMRALDM